MTQKSNSEMTAESVLELVRLFDEHQLEVILDGGWAVDALLGEQTRPHADLDIAMPHKYVGELRVVLEAHGYKEIPRSDSWECNFVMGDEQCHLVDIHTYEFDEHGQLVFGLPYPLESLTGHGLIKGYPVRCITPEWLVKFHIGYKLDEDDSRDVFALCQKFGLGLPGEYT